jgi:hypothetical protein
MRWVGKLLTISQPLGKLYNTQKLETGVRMPPTLVPAKFQNAVKWALERSYTPPKKGEPQARSQPIPNPKSLKTSAGIYVSGGSVFGMVSHELTRLSFESARAPPRASIAPPRASIAPPRASIAPPGEFAAPLRVGGDGADGAGGEGVVGLGLLGEAAGRVMNNLRVSACMQDPEAEPPKSALPQRYTPKKYQMR